MRTLYVYEGSVTVDDRDIAAATGAIVKPDVAVAIRAGSDGAEILMLQGRPIGEPVEQYGPFVMNDRAGIVQAFEDYQSTGFGGWPWGREDPVHEPSRGRFARHADGHVEEVASPHEL